MRMLDISRYLFFLQNAGWSDLIDPRWKAQVYQELSEQFPEMSEEEWCKVERVVFV